MALTKKSIENLWNLEKPNDDFFTHEIVAELLDTAEIKKTVDFVELLGDTIKEKYESIYVKMCELTNELIKKGVKGYFWIVTSPEIASIFETATAGFYPAHWNDEEDKLHCGQRPLGVATVECKGVVNCKWRLYADSEMDANLSLLGANFSQKPASEYAVLDLKNFIF